MKKAHKLIILIIILVFFAPLSTFGLVKKSEYKYVTDEANIISDDLINYICIYSEFLKDKMDINFYVVIVDSIEKYDLESYSEYVFNSFDVGSRGVLLFVSKEDRKIRVDVGYELEDALTSDTLNKYIDVYMMPYLKNGNWEDGIKNGYSALYKKICDYYNVDSSELVVYDARYLSTNYKPYIILAIIFINSYISYVFTSFFMRVYKSKKNYYGKNRDIALFVICLLINILLFYLAFMLAPLSLLVILIFELIAIKTNYDNNFNEKKKKKKKKILKHKIRKIKRFKGKK